MNTSCSSNFSLGLVLIFNVLQINDKLYYLIIPDISNQSKLIMVGGLKKLFLEISGQEMSVQKEFLSTYFENWKTVSNKPQIDDVIILGVRVK